MAHLIKMIIVWESIFLTLYSFMYFAGAAKRVVFLTVLSLQRLGTSYLLLLVQYCEDQKKRPLGALNLVESFVSHIWTWNWTEQVLCTERMSYCNANKCKMDNNCNVLLCNSELKEKNMRGISGPY